MERKVSISVNGKNLSLNDFLQELAEGIVRAVVAPLKGADPDGEIVVTIGAKDREEEDSASSD